MKCIWRKFSEEELREIVARNKSYAGVAKELGYSLGGSYVLSIQQMINHYHFNVSHFTGPAWNTGNYKEFTSAATIKGQKNFMRSKLIRERGYKCECCGNSEWMGSPITLEIHHIDEDKTNNDESNLQLLCPNCHSMTKGWRGRKQNK